MEYLVTYGWALLALFFVIALLIGSGAFSVNNFSSQECVFQPDIPCSSFIIYKENNPSTGDLQTVIAFNISNGLGFPINITNLSYSASGWGGSGVTVFEGPLSPVNLASGQSAAFSYNVTGSSQPSERDFKTVFVKLTYYNCKVPADCTGPYVTTGRISSTVERRQ